MRGLHNEAIKDDSFRVLDESLVMGMIHTTVLGAKSAHGIHNTRHDNSGQTRAVPALVTSSNSDRRDRDGLGTNPSTRIPLVNLKGNNHQN